MDMFFGLTWERYKINNEGKMEDKKLVMWMLKPFAHSALLLREKNYTPWSERARQRPQKCCSYGFSGWSGQQTQWPARTGADHFWYQIDCFVFQSRPGPNMKPDTISLCSCKVLMLLMVVTVWYFYLLMQDYICWNFSAPFKFSAHFIESCHSLPWTPLTGPWLQM